MFHRMEIRAKAANISAVQEKKIWRSSEVPLSRRLEWSSACNICGPIPRREIRGTNSCIHFYNTEIIRWNCVSAMAFDLVVPV